MRGHRNLLIPPWLELRLTVVEHPRSVYHTEHGEGHIIHAQIAPRKRVYSKKPTLPQFVRFPYYGGVGAYRLLPKICKKLIRV